MGFKKKTLAVAAAAVLTATTAVPALALENEFHGMFRLFGAVTNFNLTETTGGFGLYDPQNPKDADGNPIPNRFLDKKPSTATYFAQRARLMYVAKANDDLKLVTHFEIDSNWGDSSYAVGRNKGGAIGADQVNFETKSVYLVFAVPSTPIKVKAGIQPYNDAFKGIVFDADMAGILATANYRNFTNSIGFFRFNDAGTPGKATRDMVAVDVKYQVTPSTKLGGAYYLVSDDRGRADGDAAFVRQQAGNSNIFHTLGLNAEGSFGPVTLDGFFVYQFGNLEAPVNRHVSAFAGNVGARVKAGPGTARSEFLYVSGDKGGGSTSNAFQSVSYEHGYYNGDLQLLFRDPYSMSVDNAIVFTANNQDQGVVAGFVGYDLPVTSKLSVTANAGFAAVAKENARKPNKLNSANVSLGKNSSNYLGTEISGHVDYKLYDNLTVIARGAYVVLGDYYDGVAAGGEDPRNPYMGSFVLNYAF